MPSLTNLIEAAQHAIENAGDDTLHEFSACIGGIDHCRVTFPDGSSRDAPDEEKAEAIATTWLANRMSKQDDPDWKPSRQTMDELGIRIQAFLIIG